MQTPLETTRARFAMTPEQRAYFKAAGNAANLANANAVAATAISLANELHTSAGADTQQSAYHLFKLCNAMIALIDDGDCMAQRDSLMDELRIDEDGNPDPAVAA